MKSLRLPIVLSLVGLVVLALGPATSAQYPKWLHGATGFARAVELQRELNVSLVIYFYTDRCADCRTLEEQYLAAPPVHRALQRSIAVRINPDYGTEERQIAERYGVVSYPAFLILDHESAPPRNIQPFRFNGNHLTPEQFARACERAMTFLPMPTKAERNESRESMERLNTRAVMNATRQSGGSKIVEVRSGTAVSVSETRLNPLPAIDEILTKYVNAVGGREPQQRIKTRVIKGRIELLGDTSWGELTIYGKAPDKWVAVMNISPLGQVKYGYDGNAAWNIGGTFGTQSLTSAVLSAFSAHADLARDAKLRESYPGIRVRGIIKDKDRDFYLVEAYPRVGGAENLYFETQSGLLTGRDVTQQTSQGPVQIAMRYSDWRDVNGVKLPFKIVQSMPNLKFVFTVREVKHNVPVDDNLFERP